MTEEEEVKQGFVVKDKRRFTEDGEQREVEGDIDSEPTGSEEPAEQPSVSEANSGLEEADADPGEAPSIDFSSFIMSFATQALMQLGEIEAPEGVGIKKDKVAAKQTIDILTMLREKTTGNLGKEEDRIFEEILHNLRMSFLRLG